MRSFRKAVCLHTLERPRREVASRDSSSEAASSAVQRSRRYRAVTLASSRAASAASPAARYSRACKTIEIYTFANIDQNNRSMFDLLF